MNIRLFLLAAVFVFILLRSVSYAFYEIKKRNYVGSVAVLILTVVSGFCGISLIYGF